MTDWGQVPVVASAAALLVNGDGNPALIFNSDITTVVYLMDDKFGDPGDDTSAAPLQPLGYVAVDGSKAVWGQTLDGQTSVCDIMPGAISASASPAQIAAQINALGLAKDTSVNAPAFGPAKDSSVAAVEGAVNAPAFGPARDVTVGGVIATLGTPAQTGDITGVKNAVNAPAFGPARDTTVAGVTTALGSPAQDGSVTGLATSVPANIATTGVPLLSRSVNKVNHTLANIAASGGTYQRGAIPITQLGYEFGITLQANAAATIPFASVDFLWTDSASGLTVAEETWWLGASSGSAQSYVGTGPTKGDTLQITVTNYDTHTMAMACTFTLNSRIYVRDDWRQQTTAAVPGFTNAAYSQQSGMLIYTSPSVNSGASTFRILPLYAGLVKVGVVSGAAKGIISIINSADQTGGAGGVAICGVSVAANSVATLEAALPRANCTVEINNTDSVNGSFSVAVIAEEFAA